MNSKKRQLLKAGKERIFLQHRRTCKTHNTPHLRRHYLTGGAKEVATKPAVTRGSRSTETFDGMQQHRTVVQLARWCHVIRRKKKGGEKHINTCLPCLGETSVWGSAAWDRSFLRMVMSSRQAGGRDILKIMQKRESCELELWGTAAELWVQLWRSSERFKNVDWVWKHNWCHIVSL